MLKLLSLEVQQLASTSFAFAALLADSTVVCWGDPLCGGDSSEVQDQLRTGMELRKKHQKNTKKM